MQNLGLCTLGLTAIVTVQHSHTLITQPMGHIAAMMRFALSQSLLKAAWRELVSAIASACVSELTCIGLQREGNPFSTRQYDKHSQSLK